MGDRRRKLPSRIGRPSRIGFFPIGLPSRIRVTPLLIAALATACLPAPEGDGAPDSRGTAADAEGAIAADAGGAIAADAAGASAADAEAPFVASSRGQVFYWTGCDAWRSLSPANLLHFDSAEEAEGAGYRPSTARGCAPQLDTALIEPTVGGSAECAVARVVDGDTFVCEGGSRVRLLLVDTPELDQGPWGEEAREFVEGLLGEGEVVRLEFDVETTDRYDRLLAYVYVDSTLVNREVVRRGMGVVSVYPPNVRMVETMRAAADSARAEGAGLWSGSAFECLPADHRAGRCR